MTPQCLYSREQDKKKNVLAFFLYLNCLVCHNMRTTEKKIGAVGYKGIKFRDKGCVSRADCRAEQC